MGADGKPANFLTPAGRRGRLLRFQNSRTPLAHIVRRPHLRHETIDQRDSLAQERCAPAGIRECLQIQRRREFLRLLPIAAIAA